MGASSPHACCTPTACSLVVHSSTPHAMFAASRAGAYVSRRVLAAAVKRASHAALQQAARVRRTYSSSSGRSGPQSGHDASLSHVLRATVGAVAVAGGLDASSQGTESIPAVHIAAQAAQQPGPQASTPGPVVNDAAVDAKSKSWWQRVKQAVSILGTDVLWLAAAAGLMVAATAIGLATPNALGALWDTFSAGTDDPFSAAFKLVSCVVGRYVLNWLSGTLLTSASESAANRIRLALFDKLLHQDMQDFDAHDTADLVALLTDDVKELRDVTRAVLGEGVASLTHAVGGIMSLFYTSAPLTISLASILPAMMFVGNMYGAHLRSLSRANQEAQARTYAAVAESLGNIRTVRAFTGEEQELAKYHTLLAESSASSARLGRAITLFHAVVGLGVSSMAGGVLWYGSRLVEQERLTRGELASFLMQAVNLERSLESSSSLFSRAARAHGALSRVREVLSRKVVINRHGGDRWPQLHGNIKFEGVHFAYPGRPNAPVLSNVDLTLKAGTVTAVCGPSGSGKSTLAALLMGYYVPNTFGADTSAPRGDPVTAGQVTVDGRPLTRVDLHWLRQHVAYVPQDAAMFNASIRDNILYGNGQATEAEVEEAARAAHAWEFISKLPAGLSTRVGERGVSLSGGMF
ncbi:MAG: ABC transporter ATP-binding protein [Methanobacteriota archaeon]|nr:MAG: ABC transporter ATP-binding protein [Euryarchaeota archaeon]